MRVLAPAKINLFLSVGGRRSDGYHDIVTVMQSVTLFDELEIGRADSTTLDVEPPGAAPEDASNLVVKAATAMITATGSARGGAIRLHKQIPMSAGLAGGSADAAATLVGLNALWETGMSRKALERIAWSIGADVPFCVRGGTAVARGAGESLAPLACPVPLWWVLASGGSRLSTADVYAARDRLTSGETEDPFALADALARGDVEGVAAGLRNDLEAAAASLDAGSAIAGQALADAGALGVVMSGSGPAWCGLARDRADAEKIAAAASGGVRWLEIVRSLDRGAHVREGRR